jgi:hypothetical protein
MAHRVAVGKVHRGAHGHHADRRHELPVGLRDLGAAHRPHLLARLARFQEHHRAGQRLARAVGHAHVHRRGLRQRTRCGQQRGHDKAQHAP